MTMNGIISALLEKPVSSANRDDGYFGWTDRYGIRAAFYSDPVESRAQQRRHGALRA